MSDYLSVQDVIDHVPSQLEDKLYYDDNISGANNSWIQEDITSGESTIESYLGKYYQLPATEGDNPNSYGILRRINLDITMYLAYNRYALGTPEEVMFAYEQAIKMLKEIRDEKAYLPDLPVLEESGVGKTTIFSDDAVFKVADIAKFY